MNRRRGRNNTSSSGGGGGKKMENYRKERVIGKGSYGKVYLVKHRKRGKYFAMKIVRLQGIPKKERESVRTELALLKKLKHPNIVGYEEAFAVKNGTYLAIVMNYCDSGDLAGRLKKQKRPFPEHQVLHWFVQMALGLEFMHSNKVLHRDIKTQNIFLLGNGRLVLGDLGISKSLEGTLDMARTAIGTPYYMSPEMFQNKPYNAKSDVWALGCVLFEMLALRHAFEAKSLNELAKKVVKGRGLPSIPARYSRKAKALVTHMLRRNPRDRPTMAAILTRPYVSKHIVDFMKPIMQRSEKQMGDGTVVLKDVGLALGSGGLLQPTIPEVMSMTSQLRGLGLDEILKRALDSVSSSSSSSSRERVVSGDKKKHKITKARGVARKAKQALERNEERRNHVENALSQLRKDRERLRGRNGRFSRRPNKVTKAGRGGVRGRRPRSRGDETGKKKAYVDLVHERSREKRIAAKQRNKDVNDVKQLNRWEEKERERKRKLREKEREEMRKRCEALELVKQRRREKELKEKEARRRREAERREESNARDRVLARKAEKKKREEESYRRRLKEARDRNVSNQKIAKLKQREQYRESSSVLGSLPKSRYDDDQEDKSHSKNSSISSKLDDEEDNNMKEGKNDNVDDEDDTDSVSEVEDDAVEEDDDDDAPDEMMIKQEELEKELEEIDQENSNLRRTLKQAKKSIRLFKKKDIGSKNDDDDDEDQEEEIPEEISGSKLSETESESDDESDYEDDFDDDEDEDGCIPFVENVGGMPGALRERRQACIDSLCKLCGRDTFTALWARVVKKRSGGLDEKKALVGRFLGDVTDTVRDDVYSLIEQLLFIEMSMGK